jgi:hypothetical protein
MSIYSLLATKKPPSPSLGQNLPFCCSYDILPFYSTFHDDYRTISCLRPSLSRYVQIPQAPFRPLILHGTQILPSLQQDFKYILWWAFFSYLLSELRVWHSTHSFHDASAARVGSRSVQPDDPTGSDPRFTGTDRSRTVKITVPVCGRVGIGQKYPVPDSERVFLLECIGRVGIGRSFSRGKVGRVFQ